MTFFDFLKDLMDTAKERLKTPVTSAFFFAFIIYNWRPILLLMFSDASMEDKIVVINHEYCSLWSIILPFIGAVLYIIYVPKLSVILDNRLTTTKKARFRAIYETKENEISEKIQFAKEVNKLKDAESGNKEKQDFLDQINTLENTINQIKESNELITIADKNTINTLNLKLKELNQESREMYSIYDEDEYNPVIFEEKALKVYNKLSEKDKNIFLNLRNSHGKIDLENIPSEIKKLFISLKLVTQLKSGQWVISDRGIYAYNRIVNEFGK